MRRVSGMIDLPFAKLISRMGTQVVAMKALTR